MKVRLVPFEPWHYIDVFTTTIQFSTAVGLPDPVKTACTLADGGIAATGIAEDGSVVGCAGLVFPHAGYGIGWAMVHQGVQTWPVSDRAALYHQMRQQLDRWMQEHALKRVEANVQPDAPVAHRFIRVLGFQKESEMPHYLDGKTFTKYVRFK
jgi:RimJ/RimL family protein N-acetyltransferase